MKKNLFKGKAGNIFLAINCLILAIIFWLVVEFMSIGEIPKFMLFG